METELDIDFLKELKDEGYKFYDYQSPGAPGTCFFITPKGERSVLFRSVSHMIKILKFPREEDKKGKG